MSRRRGALDLTTFPSRPMSWGTRTRHDVRRGLARLIAGALGAALLVVAQPSDHRSGASVDALHSAAPATVPSVQHPVPLRRLATESRSNTHWPGGLGAALPAAAHAVRAGDFAQNVLARAFNASSAALVARGDDAMAPPALS